MTTPFFYKKLGWYYDLIYSNVVNYKGECDALEEIFRKFCLEEPRDILDVGCGTGSHAVILAQRGYKVCGIDISEVMIQKAKEKAERIGVEVEFKVQDMRRINLYKRFDCAICMFGGFCYLLSYDDLTRLFYGLKEHLKKDGLFIFEFWNVGGLKESPYKTWLRRQNETLTLYRMSESNFNPETNILAVNMH